MRKRKQVSRVVIHFDDEEEPLEVEGYMLFKEHATHSQLIWSHEKATNVSPQ